jgi:hypothetical protein
MASFNENDRASYQPWDEESFQSNRKARRLSTLPRWMYRTLSQAAWHCSTRPYLPDDDAELWDLAECESREQWEMYKESVRAMFTPVVINGVKLLGHPRLVRDWDKLAAKRRQMRDIGSKGGKAKATKRLAHAKQKLSKKELEIETESELETESEKKKERDFKRHLPTNQPAKTDGGLVGAAPKMPDSKSSNLGQEWREKLADEIQETANLKGVVFQMPLPEKVFVFAEQLAQYAYRGREDAEDIITTWVSDRPFDGLQNPNVAFDKMEAELNFKLNGLKETYEWRNKKAQDARTPNVESARDDEPIDATEELEEIV